MSLKKIPAGHMLIPVLILLLIPAACAPKYHSIQPYASDADAAGRLEDRALAICRRIRGNNDLPPYGFTTDGCTMYPDGEWLACCIDHDIRYWCGGSSAMRRQADKELRECAVDKGFGGNGAIMYLGSRIGGHPWWPFPWRWGYGWPWPGGYEDITGETSPGGQ